MARFVFKLRAVLTQRRNVEHLAQRQVAEAMKVMQDLKAQMEALDRTIIEVNDDMRSNRLVGRVDIQFIASHRRYLVGMQQKALQLAREMSEAQHKLVQTQRVLLEASQRRKAMEKLRDKQLERWQADQNRREADLLDEAGMQIAVQNLAEDLDS